MNLTDAHINLLTDGHPPDGFTFAVLGPVGSGGVIPRRVQTGNPVFTRDQANAYFQSGTAYQFTTQHPKFCPQECLTTVRFEESGEQLGYASAEENPDSDALKAEADRLSAGGQVTLSLDMGQVRALDYEPSSAPKVINVLGPDGLLGTFVLDADNRTSNDNGQTILVTASGLRYQKYVVAGTDTWADTMARNNQTNIGPVITGGANVERRSDGVYGYLLTALSGTIRAYLGFHPVFPESPAIYNALTGLLFSVQQNALHLTKGFNNKPVFHVELGNVSNEFVRTDDPIAEVFVANRRLDSTGHSYEVMELVSMDKLRSQLAADSVNSDELVVLFLGCRPAPKAPYGQSITVNSPTQNQAVAHLLDSTAIWVSSQSIAGVTISPDGPDHVRLIFDEGVTPPAQLRFKLDHDNSN